jgi:hypothetical protein
LQSWKILPNLARFAELLGDSKNHVYIGLKDVTLLMLDTYMAQVV